MAPNFTGIVRQLGPMVVALNNARTALYRPPQTTVGSIPDDAYPNPLQPITPMGPPKAEPLSFPFKWGENLNIESRYDAEYSAAELRQLSQYPLARVCIENNKDILTRMPWRIQLTPVQGETTKDRAKRSSKDPVLKALNKFFERPNPEQDWEQFLRPILEDMLVIDAASIFVARDKKDKIVGLRWVEGASITRKIDEHGWTPPPPSTAYQQLYEGYPRLDFTTDQLIYRPRNIVPRGSVSSYLYGFSPCEQVGYEIKIGIERLKFIYNFYSEGTIPGGILFAPLNTSIEKIKEAQQWLDSDLAGQLAKRRRLQILQGFQQEGKTEQFTFPKEPVLADMFDEIHIRKICFAFGTSPTRLMRMINRSSSESQQQSAEEEGTMPWLNWLKATMDYIIQVKMGYTEYEFAFDPVIELDSLKQSEADKIDISIGLKTRNQVLEDRGIDPSDEPAADELSVITSSGVIPLHLAEKLATMAIRTQASGGASGGGAKVRTTAQGKVGGADGRIRTGDIHYESIDKDAATNGNGNGYHKESVCAKHHGYPRAFCADCIAAQEVKI